MMDYQDMMNKKAKSLMSSDMAGRGKKRKPARRKKRKAMKQSMSRQRRGRRKAARKGY